MESIGLSYEMSKLKGKCNRLKLMYKQFSELISHTGVTYNSLTNIVEACEDTWKKFYAKHAKFKSYKRNGCKDYELAAEVFAQSVATGSLANSSMQMPLNSDEERLAEDEFLHVARLSSSIGKRSLDEMMDIVGSTRKSTNKKLREKISNAMDTVSLNMTSKKQCRKAREDASMMSTATATPYTMKACIEVLKNMSGIPQAAINVAFKCLANADLREGFIEMPPEWIMSQQSFSSSNSYSDSDDDDYAAILMIIVCVVRALVRLGREIIKPVNRGTVQPEILGNPKWYPYFEKCLGAIDGAHVAAWAPASRPTTFRGRKGGMVTQNFMAVCSHDMMFTFVYAGWEGSVNDSRIFLDALSKPEIGFLMSPEGHYYVVDGGYPNIPGFLAPYRWEAYHLNEFRGQGRIRNKQALFNYRHSSLRNVIERCFGL
ncbi:uncharacterized protein LOC116005724 [Ipomoea triloba]|uniref:uncharacterized protein LOC116005724 n=1 Tax=Ipomoea triloba TaxID=35885 RepID=UPI00125E3CB7|nr:uncharacterized protein LOC116005724 [Ipomoea triloba]